MRRRAMSLIETAGLKAFVAEWDRLAKSNGVRLATSITASQWCRVTLMADRARSFGCGAIVASRQFWWIQG
jgi:hypothetical protein